MHITRERAIFSVRWYHSGDGLMANFPRQDWSLSIYGNVKEDMPTTCPFAESGPADMPAPRGVGFTMTVWVDCDLGGDYVTRRSRTGFAVFLNGAPIYWMNKKQSSCEVSTYGSELTAMKQKLLIMFVACDKLQMMGIPCEDPTFVYGDNNRFWLILICRALHSRTK